MRYALKYIYYVNKIWIFIMLVSVCILTFSSPDRVLPVLMDSMKSAVDYTLLLAAVYALWNGLFALLEATGLGKAISKALRPLTRKLFKGESDETYHYISMNFSANFLGMGGAATPLGIKVIESMKPDGNRASRNQSLFAVINCTSIQLIPATVIALRVSAGSMSAGDIILPSLIATILSTIVGVILVYVFK